MMTAFALIAPVSVKCFQRDADHGTVVDDEVRRPGLVADLHAELVGPLDQEVDDHGGTAQLAGHRNGMAARSGLRLLDERPHLFVAGVRQALGARRDDDLAGVEAALELKTQVLQPVEVLDAAVAVGADLLVVGLAATPRPGTCTSPRAVSS